MPYLMCMAPNTTNQEDAMTAIHDTMIYDAEAKTYRPDTAAYTCGEDYYVALERREYAISIAERTWVKPVERVFARTWVQTLDEAKWEWQAEAEGDSIVLAERANDSVIFFGHANF